MSIPVPSNKTQERTLTLEPLLLAMVEGLIPLLFRAIKRSQRGSRSRNYRRLSSSPAILTDIGCFPLLREPFVELNECFPDRPDRPDRLRAGIVSPASDCSENLFRSPAVPDASKSFNMENRYYPRRLGRSTTAI